MRLGHGLFHELERTRAALAAALDQSLGRLAEIRDRRQRLVQLVHDHRGDLAHRGQPADVVQLLLKLVGPDLRRNAVRDVADEAGEDMVRAGAHLADCQLHREDRPRFVPRDHGAADADDPLFSGGEIAGEIGVVLRPIGLGHQHADIAADHLLGAVAEHPLGGGAEAADPAAGVDRDDGVGRRVDDRAQKGCVEPRPGLPLGAAGRIHRHVEERAPVVAEPVVIEPVVIELLDVEPDLEVTALLVPRRGFEAAALPGILFDLADELAPFRFSRVGEDGGECHPADLGPLITEEAPRLGIGEANAKGCRFEDHHRRPTPGRGLAGRGSAIVDRGPGHRVALGKPDGR